MGHEKSFIINKYDHETMLYLINTNLLLTHLETAGAAERGEVGV